MRRWRTGRGSYTAHFGYLNKGAARVTIPAGADNTMAPGTPDRGQPTTFEPGRTSHYPKTAFHADFDGQDLTWMLIGPDGQAHAATATASSRRCEATVDATPPRVLIQQPGAGAFVPTRTPALRLAYADDGAVDLKSLRVAVDGVDRTAWFSVRPTGAFAASDAARSLEDGPHRIEVSLSDDAGHASQVSSSFVVDTVAPQVTVLEPHDGALESATSIDVTGAVLDKTAVSVTVGGTSASMKDGSFRARARAARRRRGSHACR